MASDTDNSFFGDPRLSDVTIKIGNKSIKAHKVILARGSKWFEKALCEVDRKCTLKVIHLDDIDIKAVRAMMRYLYKPNLQDYLNTLQEANSATPKVHARVYIIAVKYGVDDLQQELSTSMTSHCDFRWCDPTDEVRSKSHKDLIEALKIIWEGTSSDDSIARPHLAAHCASNLKALCEHAKFVKLMRDTDLSSDICIAMAKRQKEHGELEKELREEQEAREKVIANSKHGYGAWDDGAWDDGTRGDGAWGNDALDDGAWDDGAWDDGAWDEGAWDDGAGDALIAEIRPKDSVKGCSSKTPSVSCFGSFKSPGHRGAWPAVSPKPSVLSSLSNDSGNESFGWDTPAPSLWDTDSLP